MHIRANVSACLSLKGELAQEHLLVYADHRNRNEFKGEFYIYKSTIAVQVLLPDSVLHACDIVFDVRNAVPAIFGAEFDDGRADDHAVSVSSHFLRLLRC